MLPRLHTDSDSSTPLYRQLYEQLSSAIADGRLTRGERLPATRELAGSIGLNRTTIAAAYDLLESEGLVRSHVGKGTFVEGPKNRVDWSTLTPGSPIQPEDSLAAHSHQSAAQVSFSASRPSEDQFPLDEFRATCREVIDSPEAAQILQLGPASGYGPLRRYLMNEARQARNGSATTTIF